MKNKLLIICTCVFISLSCITNVMAKTSNNTILNFNIKEISSDEENKLKESVQDILTKYENDPLSYDLLKYNMDIVKKNNPTFYTQIMEKLMDQTLTVTNIQPVLSDAVFMTNVHYNGYDLSNVMALAKSYINMDGEEFQRYSPTISNALREEIPKHNQRITELFNEKLNNLERVDYDFSVFSTRNELGYNINQNISSELFNFLAQDFRIR